MSKLLYIQILRACAALSVAILHAQSDAEAASARLGWLFERVDRIPWEAGVDVFFVISGFVMVYASRGMFASPGARKVFLVRRIGRIVPLYWAVTTLYLVIALIRPELLNSEILEPWPVIASYLFIPVARPDGLVQPLYSLGWTLNFEMYFYVLFTVALVLPRRGAVLSLIGVLAVFVALGRALRLPEPLAFWTSPLILEFAFGMGLGLLKTEGLALSRTVRALLLAAGLGLLVFWAHADLARPLAYGLPASLLVAAAALGVDRAGAHAWPARLGGVLGDASYAIYLLHPFVMRAGREVVVRSGLGSVIGPWGYLVLVLSVTLVASVFVFRWFERPMMALVRRRSEEAGAPKLATVNPSGPGTIA